MDEESGQESSFKVVDRRRFNAKGEPENTSEQAESKAEETKNSEAAKQETDAAKSAASSGARPEDLREAAGASSSESLNFSSFVMSLATQAMVMLGEMPNPETGLSAANYEAAKQTIDILALLDEKTEGNLSQVEEKLMKEVLASLRMAYVAKIKGR